LQKNLEERSLSIIKDPKTFSDMLQQGVNSDCFIIFTEVFDFINRYYHKYNSIPANSIINSNFPEFSYIQEVKSEEVKFLADELIKGSVQRKAVRIINEAQDLIVDDPYGTIESTINKLASVRRKVVETRSFTDRDSIKRYEYVVQNKERIKKGITVGIKTGINLFDEKYLGWQPGQLIVVAGRLGIGKSWVILYFGCEAYKTGKRVLYLSPEMPLHDVEFRWDTIMGKSRGFEFLNDKLILGDVNLKDYRDYLTDVSRRSDWLTIDSNFGLSFSMTNINNMVDEFCPDLVVIDGISFIEAHSRDIWEKMKIICDELKKLAQNQKVVIIVSAQVSREAGDNMPKMTQIAYSDSILQAADYGVMMSGDVEKPDIRYITIPKIRSGKAVNSRIMIKFDVNRGIIEI